MRCRWVGGAHIIGCVHMCIHIVLRERNENKTGRERIRERERQRGFILHLKKVRVII